MKLSLSGIVIALHTGILWKDLPQELGFGSGMTYWRRLRDWQASGVWTRMHLALLTRLREHGQIDWSRASIDAAAVASPRGPADRSRGGIGHLDQQHGAAHALHQYAHCRAVTRTLDGVAFPVPGHEPVVDLRRALMDADHVGNLATPVGATRAQQVLSVALAQTSDELATQFAARVGVNGVVDGLVGHVALAVVRKGALESSGISWGDHFWSRKWRTTRHSTLSAASLRAGRLAWRRCARRAYAVIAP